MKNLLFLLVLVSFSTSATDLCPVGHTLQITSSVLGNADDPGIDVPFPTSYWGCKVTSVSPISCHYVAESNYSYCLYNATYTGEETNTAGFGGLGGAGGTGGANGVEGSGGQGGEGGKGGDGGAGGHATVDISMDVEMQGVIDAINNKDAEISAINGLETALINYSNATGDFLTGVGSVVTDSIQYIQDSINALTDAINSMSPGSGCVPGSTDASCSLLDQPGPIDEPLPGEPGGLIDTDSLTWTPGVLGETGVCPGNQTISFGGYSATISMQPVCSAASDYLRPFVLVLASLSAYYIFVGGLRA